MQESPSYKSFTLQARNETSIPLQLKTSSIQQVENTSQTDLQHSGPSVSFLHEVFLFAVSNELKQILRVLLLIKEC